jgi:OTU domain-containing protein 6
MLQTADEPSSSPSGTANGHTTPQRISKAQKRRIKKVTQLKERELRILEQDMSNLHGPRHVETEEIKRILKERNLMISEVPSDGDWCVISVNDS